MSKFLKVTHNGQILEIVLDRPKANTLDAALSREMGRIFAEFRDDPSMRVASTQPGRADTKWRHVHTGLNTPHTLPVAPTLSVALHAPQRHSDRPNYPAPDTIVTLPPS